MFSIYSEIIRPCAVTNLRPIKDSKQIIPDYTQMKTGTLMGRIERYGKLRVKRVMDMDGNVIEDHTKNPILIIQKLSSNTLDSKSGIKIISQSTIPINLIQHTNPILRSKKVYDNQGNLLEDLSSKKGSLEKKPSENITPIRKSIGKNITIVTEQ